MMQQTKKKLHHLHRLLLLPAPVLHSPFVRKHAAVWENQSFVMSQGALAPFILLALGMLSSGDPYSFQDN